MKPKENWLIVLLIILALFIRIVPIDFPFFTSDEARIAVRGYSLATSGKDELGRLYPLLFNSLVDYQLPAVSYITALGEIVFGRSDFGVRLPFILLGVAQALLIYKIAQFFSPRKEFWFFASSVTAFSPGLVFFSKTPNEYIVLVFLLSFLFYSLIKSNPNSKLILILIILLFLSSKFAWFIVPPFVILTLIFFPHNLQRKTKLKISLVCILISFLALLIFWQVPQSGRSLLENNFSIFSDLTIKNGINQLRGQGLQSHWPSFLEKILFNKVHFLVVGFLNWFSQLQPANFFGSINAGILQKVLIIPFVIGLGYIISRGKRKEIMLLIYPFFLTFPLLFLSLNNSKELILFALPFVSLIIALGFIHLNHIARVLIIGIMVFEIGINFLNLDMNKKISNELRPSWVKEMIIDGLNTSSSQRVAFSDDLTNDIAPFIQWFGKLEAKDYEDIKFPYKFRQNRVSGIKIISSDRIFYKCGYDKPTYIIASKRDVAEIERWLNVKTEEITIKAYKDNLGYEVAYFFEPTICIQ